nr:putative glutathione-specific gamma-glutamylcyclotransferase 2 [Quercus suber]
MNEEKDETADLWLFGYGFEDSGPYRRMCSALLAAILSEDHRGTPEAPGRVVTLIDRKHWESLVDFHASAPPKVWGAAYRIPSAHVAAVKEYLDIREINGYSIQYAPFTPGEAAKGELPQGQIDCLVYIGLPDNPQFLGPQDPQSLAEHIIKSRGPSGENKEYLYQLEAALDGLSPESNDPHITDLARRCRQVEARQSSGSVTVEAT